MALPIALQVYSVRKDAEADLRGTLEQIKKMGYDGVEFAGFDVRFTVKGNLLEVKELVSL